MSRGKREGCPIGVKGRCVPTMIPNWLVEEEDKGRAGRGGKRCHMVKDVEDVYKLTDWKK